MHGVVLFEATEFLVLCSGNSRNLIQAFGKVRAFGKSRQFPYRSRAQGCKARSEARSRLRRP